MGSQSDLYQRIYTVVKRIPPGRVATYGQVAVLAGARSPRIAGYAMARVTDPEVPWQRVVNSRGEISIRASGDPCRDQKLLLEAEGVRFSTRNRIDLALFGWSETADDIVWGSET